MSIISVVSGSTVFDSHYTNLKISAEPNGPAQAGGIDILRGKFAFNWLGDPAKAKCIEVDGKLLNDFKSERYRCDLKSEYKFNTNSSSGASSRTCTQIPRDKEYLVFDTKQACDEEGDTQASNE